jgi:hypothetical protein
MGLYWRDVKVPEAERVLVEARAKRTRSTPWLNGAGTAVVTDAALRWEPSRLDLLTGWRPVVVQRNEVTKAEAIPSGRIMMPRLAIELADRRRLEFLTSDADKLAAVLAP